MPNLEPMQQQPVLSETQIAFAVYVLYFAGYLTGITAIIGVIIAHVKVGTADPLLRSHYEWQIRTFWIGLLYLFAGAILAFILVGFLIWLWWLIWSLVRTIKGILALNENRPVADPRSWMFG
jgi:uncharacterized membrane protein